MSDTKIFTFPDGGCGSGSGGVNTALLASLVGRQGQDPMATAAMMNGGMNGQWNNPFIYLVWMMFAQRFFGNGWGNDGNGQGSTAAQLEALREQMNSNQNSNLLMDAIKGNNTAIGQLAGQLNCDFNTLNSAICDVRGGIDRLSGQVGSTGQAVINAIERGNCTLGNQLAQCCCSIQDAVTRQGYENQLATVNQTNQLQSSINFVNSSVERGFAATNYATADQTCQLKQAIQDSTAQILAGQKAAEFREIQREVQALRDERTQFQMSALLQQQSANLINTLRPCPIPSYQTCNPWGCNGGFVGNGYSFSGYPYGYNEGGCGFNG